MREGVIKPLPESVKSSVRSGVLVFDLTRVVEELIFNSLDAGATKISVAVGVGTGYIKVVDNGSGITRDGLVLLGEKYATSKFDQLADMDTVTRTFGFRGEALGSISDVSLLEIITKAHGRPNGYRKVMKGCKCLYLGIDDARQDVGTTVVVRDLFYNQPVRRKQLQSSEDELLFTHPSTSPFPLLMSGFGIELSDSLHEINASDGILKLSGYISDPCEDFSGKAVQYVYINSRFICKGPIHKRLSQLADKFICLDLYSTSGKRRKVQTLPSYILNVGCPRSLYDLTFEPSKTSAEFKDWNPILSFIEKALTKFWSKTTSNGNCSSRGADTLENVDMWKEGGNNFESEDVAADCGMKKKRYRTQFCQASLELPSPRKKMLVKEFKYLSPCKSNRGSCLKSSRKPAKFDEHQVETGFACETNYSFQLHDGVFSPCRDAVDQENCRHLERPDGGVYFAEHNFLEDNFTTERSNGHVDCIGGTGCNGVSLKLDVDMPDISQLSGGLFADCFEVGDAEQGIRETLREEKPFVRGCSSRRDLLSDRALSSSHKRFRYYETWLGHVDRGDIGETDNTNHLFDSWQEERPSVRSITRRLAQDDMSMDADIPARDSMQLFSVTKECFDKDRDIKPESDDHSQKCESKHVTFKPKWSCVTPNPYKKIVPREGEHFMDDYVLEKNFERASYAYSADREDTDSISGNAGMQNNFDWGECSSSRCMESDFKDYGSSQNDICNFHNDTSDYDLFPVSFDKYSNEIRKYGIEACEKNKSITSCELLHHVPTATWVDEDKDQRTLFSCHGKTHRKRPRRSRSAPPHYRGKKKFLASNSSLNVEAGNSQIATVHDAPILKGTCDLEHHKQSFDLNHLSSGPQSALVSLNDFRLGTGTTNKKEVQNCEMQTGDQHLHVHMDSEDYISEKSLDSLEDSKIKWRSSCLTANGENLNNFYKKGANILDISSGLLHLAGDSLVPKSISKDCLDGAKVLQQIDKKYIPVVGGGVLAIIDQHAADERIRLEELRQKVLSGDMKTITYLDEEQQLVLPELGHQLLLNYAEQIQNWGWICNININSSRSFKRDFKLLQGQSSAITLLAVPCILGVSLTDADLLEFLQQLADTGGSSPIPPSVLRVLNYKACRGAIMFGDALLPSECSLIVEELKQTSLCFQCAHGRPTTVPLVNLELLHKQIPKLGLQCSSSNELWHGLRRHAATLERAYQRLNSAGG